MNNRLFVFILLGLLFIELALFIHFGLTHNPVFMFVWLAQFTTLGLIAGK